MAGPGGGESAAGPDLRRANVFPTLGAKATRENQEVYFESFAALEKTWTKEGPAWVHNLRREALERFGELGFPTTHDEEWKYTNVAPITKIPFRPGGYELDGEIAGEFRKWVEGLRGPRLVFVNGQYCEELSFTASLPAGVKAGSLAGVWKDGAGETAWVEQNLARRAGYLEHAFVALNTAFLADGAFLWVPKGLVLEEPVYLLFVSTGTSPARVSHPRSLVVTGQESQLALVEGYVGWSEEAYLTNAVTEIVTGENSVLEHYKIQQETDRAFHVATLHVEQARDSSFTDHSVSLGGALVRNEINVVLGGEGGECALNGLYLATGRQHVDNHTRIDHGKPHCGSREVYKGILDDKAVGVFNGGIIVRPDAQKTDAKQSNKNLLLSEDATINTKPQLEIWANDVKCTHGATIGQMDAEAVFYLCSRGIGRKDARDMLTYAFANDVLTRMKVEAVRSRMESALFARLSGNGRPA